MSKTEAEMVEALARAWFGDGGYDAMPLSAAIQVREKFLPLILRWLRSAALGATLEEHFGYCRVGCYKIGDRRFYCDLRGQELADQLAALDREEQDAE